MSSETSAEPSWQLSLLSGFELRRDHHVLAVPNGSQRVLAFLALQVRPVRRSFVSGSLWPDANEARAAARLRSALWRLPVDPDGGPVQSTATHLAIGCDVGVDYRRVLGLATHIIDGRAPARDHWRELEQMSLELLPDCYDDWALSERERFRQVCLHALEAAGEQFAQDGQFGRALLAGLAAVAADPLRESAHRLVVQAHIGEGDLDEAYRQYCSCASLLQSELGLSPTRAMESLVASLCVPNIRRGVAV